MGKESGGSARQETAKQAFEHFCALLALDLPVSGRRNAKYGIRDVAPTLACMCPRRIASGSAACATGGGPTPRRAPGVPGAPSAERAECEKMPASTVRAAVWRGMPGRACTTAIGGRPVPSAGDGKAAGGKPGGGAPRLVRVPAARGRLGRARPPPARPRETGPKRQSGGPGLPGRGLNDF